MPMEQTKRARSFPDTQGSTPSPCQNDGGVVGKWIRLPTRMTTWSHLVTTTLSTMILILSCASECQIYLSTDARSVEGAHVRRRMKNSVGGTGSIGNIEHLLLDVEQFFQQLLDLYRQLLVLMLLTDVLHYQLLVVLLLTVWFLRFLWDLVLLLQGPFVCLLGASWVPTMHCLW